MDVATAIAVCMRARCRNVNQKLPIANRSRRIYLCRRMTNEHLKEILAHMLVVVWPLLLEIPHKTRSNLIFLMIVCIRCQVNLRNRKDRLAA